MSCERNQSIDLIINLGILTRLVEFLLNFENPVLQFESAWALTNIASGATEHTFAVVNEGAVPHFIKLLGSPDHNVQEQAVWALGNIAGDGPGLRDFVIFNGFVGPLITLVRLRDPAPVSFLRTITWTITNLCRNKNPQPPFEVVSQFLPVLVALLQQKDQQIIMDTCWAPSYLTDGTDNQIQV